MGAFVSYGVLTSGAVRGTTEVTPRCENRTLKKDANVPVGVLSALLFYFVLPIASLRPAITAAVLYKFSPPICFSSALKPLERRKVTTFLPKNYLDSITICCGAAEKNPSTPATWKIMPGAEHKGACKERERKVLTKGMRRGIIVKRSRESGKKNGEGKAKSAGLDLEN